MANSLPPHQHHSHKRSQRAIHVISGDKWKGVELIVLTSFRFPIPFLGLGDEEGEEAHRDRLPQTRDDQGQDLQAARLRLHLALE